MQCQQCESEMPASQPRARPAVLDCAVVGAMVGTGPLGAGVQGRTMGNRQAGPESCKED